MLQPAKLLIGIDLRVLIATVVLLPIIVAATTRCVNVVNGNATAPYINWSTAATNIQDAIDVSNPGDLILVTNGVYQTGGRVMYGSIANRVVVNKAVLLRSVNGSAVTIIQGYQVPGAIYGGNAVRCVYLTNGATLSGFTLTNGATRNFGGSPPDLLGGGVWCESSSAVVSNCVFTGNASYAGGGANGGTLVNCIFDANTAYFGGGAAYSSILNNCTLTNNSSHQQAGGAHYCTASNCVITYNIAPFGGGAYGGTLSFCNIYSNTAVSGAGANSSVLNNCLLAYNDAETASGTSGGANAGTLNNCVLVGNYSSVNGGGAGYALLNNCTLVDNFAESSGGGAIGSTLKNCIVYYNSAISGSNFDSSSKATNCFTVPLSVGLGNLTNAPLFMDHPGGNLRLQTNSLCINAGSNAFAVGGADVDGRPRIVGGKVDVGAYEYQGPGMGEFIGWLKQNGLATDGSADFIDTDNDGMNNWQEWRAGTDPIDPLSVLKMTAASKTVSGVTVNWQSVNGINYFVQRTTILRPQPMFTALQSNIVGQAGTTTLTDSNATGFGPFFYRVGVQ